MTAHRIETDRLLLRPPEVADVPVIVAFYESERAQFVGGNVPRYQAFGVACATLGNWQVRGYGLWAVTEKSSNELIGLVGPFYPDGWPETEIGWMVFDGVEGQGIAFEAARAVIDHARNELGWTNIVHYIAENNTRSISLAERLGAVLDPNAKVPKPDKPCLVYRQPGVAA